MEGLLACALLLRQMIRLEYALQIPSGIIGWKTVK